MQQALCTDAASSPHACARARVTCGRARRGQGVLELASGARYEGDFVEGAREGFGELVFPAGTGRYCGSFSDGQQDGWGEMAYANGDRRVPPLHLRHRPTHARARSLKTSLPAQVRRRLEGRATARARHHALRKRHGGAGRVAPRRPSGAGPAAQRGCARQRLARACARALMRGEEAARAGRRPPHAQLSPGGSGESPRAVVAIPWGGSFTARPAAAVPGGAVHRHAHASAQPSSRTLLGDQGRREPLGTQGSQARAPRPPSESPSAVEPFSAEGAGRAQPQPGLRERPASGSQSPARRGADRQRGAAGDSPLRARPGPRREPRGRLKKTVDKRMQIRSVFAALSRQ